MIHIKMVSQVSVILMLISEHSSGYTDPITENKQQVSGKQM